jgi:hypothetical protein
MSKTAIPWDYDGIPFRSKLEAKWYAVFKLMGLDVQYEPGCHVLRWVDGSERNNYLPDFLVSGRYIEIKPLRDEYPDRDHASVWSACVLGYSVPTVVICGEPRKFFAFETNERHKGSPLGHHLNGELERADGFFLATHYPDEQQEPVFPFEEFKRRIVQNKFALEAEKLIQWKPK